MGSALFARILDGYTHPAACRHSIGTDISQMCTLFRRKAPPTPRDGWERLVWSHITNCLQNIS